MKKTYYPTKYWKKATPESKNINKDIIDNLNKMILNDFSQIKSAIIIKEDAIIYEKYFKGYSEYSLHESACIFKSFLSTVIGTALKNDLIESVDQKITDIFKDEMPEDLDENFKKITVKHLLTKTSGITWPAPDYKFPEDKRYNDIRLPFSLKITDQPGEVFTYKPDPHILYLIIEKLSGLDFVSYADDSLLSYLGISDYVWNTNFYNDECLLMKTRDIAKLGYLYLKNGLWEENQIISPEYINEAITKQVDGSHPENNPYGYLWWITEYSNYKCFYAGGYGGQYLCVVPELELIFVITSDMDRPHPENKFLVKEFLGMIRSSNNVISGDRVNKRILNLRPEERDKLLREIQTFFEQERDVEIGIIAAGKVLDFFLDDLGTSIYNKSLDDARFWSSKRLEDIDFDYDMLYKESKQI